MIVAGKRDPRAWRVDDDPFDKLESKRAPPSHSSARDDSSRRRPPVRLVFATNKGGGEPFFRVFGEAPKPKRVYIHQGSIWHFSKIEIQHLIQATFAFTLALAFMSVNTGGLFSPIFEALNHPSEFIIGGGIYFIALAPAFLLHEIAHKILARKYGCWAEFRASPAGLRFGVILAAVIGIVFMAPGAVMVMGNTTKQQFGKIALAGPVTNIALWIIGLIAVLFGAASIGLVKPILVSWMWGNAVLATFNMIPFGPLDGRKIKTWSTPVFYIWMVICVSLIWFNFEHLNSLL
jgi:Zn-dependent protease